MDKEDIKTDEVDINDTRSPKYIDIYAGEQLRIKRLELKMTQKTLASLVGVTFQQIQKYEKGLNRIGASRLYDFCKVLGVKPSFFFQNIEYTTFNKEEKQGVGLMKDSANDDKNNSADVIELIQLFNAIKNPTNKKLVLKILKSFVVSES